MYNKNPKSRSAGHGLASLRSDTYQFSRGASARVVSVRYRLRIERVSERYILRIKRVYLAEH